MHIHAPETTKEAYIGCEALLQFTSACFTTTSCCIA